MTSNKKLRARGRRDKPGSGPNYDKAHGLIPRQPDPPKTGKYPNSPAPLIELVVKWCKHHGYHRAIHAIRTETQKREATGGYTKPCSWDNASNRYPTLVEMFEEWKKMHPEIPEWMPASEYHAKFILPDALKKEEERKRKEERKKRDEKGDFSDTSISDEDEDDDEDDDGDEDEDSKSESEASDTGANEIVWPENVPLPESDSGSSEEESESESDESEESESESESEVSVNEEESQPSAELNSGTNPLKRKAPASSSSSDEDEDEDEDEESDAESDQEPSQDEELQVPTEPKASGAGLKRKAPSSSSSEDDSSDEETSDEEPAAKKAKLENPTDSAGSSGSSEDDSDEEMEDASSKGPEESNSGDQESSDEQSDSESEASDEENEEDEENSEELNASVKKAAKPSAKRSSKNDIAITNGNASDSSQTLHATSPQFNAAELANHKIDKANLNKGKSNIPFSRVSADQRIDPKFASNKYISYDYADKAHRDLVVTKGKNFTKEKNKKKRGAYRGGVIDTASRGIKFED